MIEKIDTSRLPPVDRETTAKVNEIIDFLNTEHTSFQKLDDKRRELGYVRPVNESLQDETISASEARYKTALEKIRDSVCTVPTFGPNCPGIAKKALGEKEPEKTQEPVVMVIKEEECKHVYGVDADGEYAICIYCAHKIPTLKLIIKRCGPHGENCPFLKH